MRAEGSEKLFWPSFSDRSLCTFVEAHPALWQRWFDHTSNSFTTFLTPSEPTIGSHTRSFLSSRWNMPKQLHFQMRTSHFLRKMVNFGTMTGMGQWQMAIWLAQHIFEASARNICFIQFKIWTKYAKFDTYKKGLSCSYEYAKFHLQPPDICQLWYTTTLLRPVKVH